MSLIQSEETIKILEALSDNRIKCVSDILFGYYKYPISGSEDDQKVKLIEKELLANNLVSIAEAGSSNSTINGYYYFLITPNGREHLKNLVNAQSTQSQRVRTALSTNKNDNELHSQGLANRGLLGYLDQAPTSGTFALEQYLLTFPRGLSHFYTTNPSIERFHERNPRKLETLGYARRSPALHYHQLYGFFNEIHQHHLFIVNPNLDAIGKSRFKDESQENPIYIKKIYTGNEIPLYLYSNSNENHFSPIIDDDDSESESGSDNATNGISFSPKKETIPGLISDSEKGIDYLDITRDVNAFARVVAAKSFEPPLAIALFGKWGSGKSFFMRKLKEQITKLSSNETKGIYCEGIAHIHFNAWSYMDSNLWASLVTKIFEELNEYISENRKAEIEKKVIEKLLTDKLSITKEEIGMLESKKESVALQISSLEKKKEIITKELDENITKVKTDTIWTITKTADKEFNAEKQILNALKENYSFQRTESDLKSIVPEKYWSDPNKTYQLARSRYTFLKEFFRLDKIQTNLICLALILVGIAFTPLILEMLSLQISKMNFLIPQAALSLLITGGAIWRRAETVYNELQPIIASFWKVKESHENKIKEARSTFEQAEKALKLEIEKAKSEVLLIQEQIQKAEAVKTDLDFRINNAFATEALYSFIDRRSKSEDYKKHLGLISMIRRDFEILNDLFTDHNQEAEKIKNAKEFKDKFKKPLERIVLYIDDLDRCPEENVVQVLEAVNLLMAFPLFVVVVGVDSRWVKNALIKKHRIQFTGKQNDNGAIDSNLELIEPSNYLEKIFQIPFHLKDAKDTSVKDMIRKLAESKTKPTGYFVKGAIEEGYVLNTTINLDQEKNSSDQNATSSQAVNSIPIDKPEALILTDEEITLMQDVSEIVGKNPRAIKRFVNIYRIIKVHQEFDYATDSTNQEVIAILFLLALPLGDYKKLLPSFDLFIQDNANTERQLGVYLQSFHVVDGFNELKSRLNDILSKNKVLSKIQRTPTGIFKQHNIFIRRFTFNHI